VPPLQNFLGRIGPVIKSVWLNAVDTLMTSVFSAYTGSGYASNSDQALSGLKVQMTATDTGSAGVAVVAAPPGVSFGARIPLGFQLTFTPAAVNPGAATLAFAGFSAAAILNQAGAALGGGELAVPVTVVWQGANWKLVGPAQPFNPRTLAESLGGVTPVRAQYEPSHIGYDVRRAGIVGDGVMDNTAALHTLATMGVALYFAPGTYRIARNLTLGVALWMDQGAIIRPDAGVTVTVNASIVAGAWQVFDVSKIKSKVTGIRHCDIRCEWFGPLDPKGTTDNSAYFQAWLTAGVLSAGKSGNMLGTFTCQPGTYKITQTMNISRTQRMMWAGVTLNFASAPDNINSAIAIMNNAGDTDFDGIDPLGAVALIGPGGSTTLTGIHVSGGVQPLAGCTMRLGRVSGFKYGISYGRNNWDLCFIGGYVSGNSVGVYAPGAVNAGEGYSFVGTNCANNTVSNLQCYGDAIDISWHGGSVGQPATGASTNIDVSRGCNLSFHGTHIEHSGAANDTIHALANTTANSLAPVVNFHGCQFVWKNGGDIAEIIDATNINVGVYGCQLHIIGSKAQDTFIKSVGNGTCVCFVSNVETGGGGVTTMVKGTGGGGGKIVMDPQVPGVFALNGGIGFKGTPPRAMFSSALVLSNNTTAGATTGNSGAPPAQVAGYLSVYCNGASYKIPFYNP
jgi:hypothetical protein